MIAYRDHRGLSPQLPGWCRSTTNRHPLSRVLTDRAPSFARTQSHDYELLSPSRTSITAHPIPKSHKRTDLRALHRNCPGRVYPDRGPKNIYQPLTSLQADPSTPSVDTIIAPHHSAECFGKTRSDLLDAIPWRRRNSMAAGLQHRYIGSDNQPTVRSRLSYTNTTLRRQIFRCPSIGSNVSIRQSGIDGAYRTGPI